MTKDNLIKIIKKKRYLFIVLALCYMVGFINLYFDEIATGIIILVVISLAVFLSIYKEDPN